MQAHMRAPLQLASTPCSGPMHHVPQITAAEILGGNQSPPREATILYNELKKYLERYSAPA